MGCEVVGFGRDPIARWAVPEPFGVLHSSSSIEKMPPRFESKSSICAELSGYGMWSHEMPSRLYSACSREGVAAG